MKHSFTFNTPPKLLPLIHDELWELAEDWAVTVDGQRYTIPAGFVTDGASIPRILWRVCGHPMSTKRFPVALFHDWAYAYECPYLFDRRLADEIYRDGLISLGFKPWKANLEYATLRLCGASHFRR